MGSTGEPLCRKRKKGLAWQRGGKRKRSKRWEEDRSSSHGRDEDRFVPEGQDASFQPLEKRKKGVVFSGGEFCDDEKRQFAGGKGRFNISCGRLSDERNSSQERTTC